MFSVPSLTRKANRAISSRASSGEFQLHAFGVQQRDVLLDQRRLRLGQNADEVFHGERLQLHADGEAALQLGNQVAGLGDVERAGGDEQDVIGAHHAVAGVDGRAFDDRQNVALHAFAGDVGAVAAFAPGDLVDFVEEDDAGLFHALDGHARDLIHIDEPLLFFLDQVFESFVAPSSSASWCAGRRCWATCL